MPLQHIELTLIEGDGKRNLVGGRYAVATVNKIVAILRQITAEASDEFNIADPCRRVADVSNRGHRSYTREAPNALKPADVPRFLDEGPHALARSLRVRVPGLHDRTPAVVAAPVAPQGSERRCEVGLG